MLYRLRNHVSKIVETSIFVCIIAVSIILYVFVSELVGIFTIASMILILFIYYFFSSPGSINRLKYNGLMKSLIKFPMIREQDINNNLNWSEQKLHKAMYSLSKTWQYGPMVLFIKPYYLFINEKIIALILKKMIPISQQSSPNFLPLIKSISAKYSFQSRQEVEKVIEKLRELPDFKKLDPVDE